MADIIGKYMEGYNTKFIKEATPVKLERPNGPEGKILVSYK